MIKDVRNLLKLKKKMVISYSNNYIEYGNNSDRNKTLLIKEYLNKNKIYLKDIINNFKESNT